jgi:hypothetical protein
LAVKGKPTTLGEPVELDIHLSARLVYELECVHTKTWHVTVVEWDAYIIEQERKHVARFRMVTEKVPDAPPLLQVVLGVRLEGVHHVRETDAVTDEKDWHVVANHVIVSFARVKLDGEATGVAKGLRGAALVDYGGEAHSHRCLDPRGSQEVGACQARNIVCDLKKCPDLVCGSRST